MSDDIAELEYGSRPQRIRVLSWMVSLAVAARDSRSAEGYLLELLAVCVLFDGEGKEVVQLS